MGPLGWAKVLPRPGEMWSKPFELFEVESGQHLQSLGSLPREPQPNHSMVVLVPGPIYQTGGVSTVDETDCAVVQQQQIVSHLADGRATRITVPTYGQ